MCASYQNKFNNLIVHRIVPELGSMVAALRGFEELVIMAGIGERAEEVRGRVYADIGWLGTVLDDHANIADGPAFRRAVFRSGWSQRMKT